MKRHTTARLLPFGPHQEKETPSPSYRHPSLTLPVTTAGPKLFSNAELKHSFALSMGSEPIVLGLPARTRTRALTPSMISEASFASSSSSSSTSSSASSSVFSAAAPSSVSSPSSSLPPSPSPSILNFHKPRALPRPPMLNSSTPPCLPESPAQKPRDQPPNPSRPRTPDTTSGAAPIVPSSPAPPYSPRRIVRLPSPPPLPPLPLPLSFSVPSSLVDDPPATALPPSHSSSHLSSHSLSSIRSATSSSSSSSSSGSSATPTQTPTYSPATSSHSLPLPRRPSVSRIRPLPLIPSAPGPPSEGTTPIASVGRNSPFARRRIVRSGEDPLTDDHHTQSVANAEDGVIDWELIDEVLTSSA